MKEMMSQAEVYVYEEDKMIQGFDIQCEGFDDAIGEKEYTMLWQQK